MSRLLNIVNSAIEVLSGLCISEIGYEHKIELIKTKLDVAEETCIELARATAVLNMDNSEQVTNQLMHAVRCMRDGLLVLAQMKKPDISGQHAFLTQIAAPYRIVIAQLRYIDSNLDLSAICLQRYERRLPYFNRALNALGERLKPT